MLIVDALRTSSFLLLALLLLHPNAPLFAFLSALIFPGILLAYSTFLSILPEENSTAASPHAYPNGCCCCSDSTPFTPSLAITLLRTQ